jgi:hypothetical protein
LFGDDFFRRLVAEGDTQALDQIQEQELADQCWDRHFILTVDRSITPYPPQKKTLSGEPDSGQ